jgi:phosphatidylglycerophosphatase A
LPLRTPTWPAVLLGFVLFRLFDVIKPGPVSALEKLPAGWGIVLDDVAAGALAALSLVILRAVVAMPALVE